MDTSLLEVSADLLEGNAPAFEGDRKIARRALSAILSQYWAVTPEALELMIQIVLRRNQEIEAIATKDGKELENTYSVRVRDGIATIPVTGPLFRFANLFSMLSGASSYELIARDIGAALENAEVKGILLDVDSPGGEVQGTSDLAQLIYDARGQKPIWAHAGGFAASAAYWIASAADVLVGTDTAVVGSIGVVAAFTETKDADAQQGIRRIEIVSSQSPLKHADPSQGKGRKAVQQTVDDLADVFIKAVARNRDVSVDTVLKDFGAGDVLVGKRALRAGMIDRIASFEDTHAALVALCNGDTKRRKAAADIDRNFDLAASADACTDKDSPAAAFCQLLRTPDGLETARRINRLEGIAAEILNPRNTIDPDAGSDELDSSTASANAPATSPDTIQGVKNMPNDKGTATAPDVGSGTNRQDEVLAMFDLASKHPDKIAIADVTAMVKDGKGLPDVQARILNAYKNSDSGAVYETPAADSGHITHVRDRELDKPFASIGEQMIAVYYAEHPTQRKMDNRLLELNAAASGMGETVGPEGGFVVEKVSAQTITQKVYETGELLSRMTPIPIGPGKNGLKKRYIKESSRADGSRAGGVRAYWRNEAATVTSSEPILGMQELDLNDVMAIMYATDELLEDAVALSALVYREVPNELVFKVEDAIVNGTGSGQPLGVMAAPCLISVDKEDGQDAATVWFKNIVNMWSRAWARSRRTGFWIYNQDIEPELFTMGVLVGTGGVPAYMPPGGLSQSPYGTMFGRPMIAVEYCQTLGTVGDIIWFSPNEYELIEKGGINAASSLHVRFLYKEMTFRFDYRVDGQPNWDSALTPKNGTKTLSPFVALATRA